MGKTKKCRHKLFTEDCIICRYRCKHGKQRTRCLECGGSSLCIHKIERYYCRLCMGSGICKHKKNKRVCKLCKLEKNKLINKKIDYFLNDHFSMNLMEFYILQLGF